MIPAAERAAVASEQLRHLSALREEHCVERPDCRCADCGRFARAQANIRLGLSPDSILLEIFSAALPERASQ